jgi:hypothetical protein
MHHFAGPLLGNALLIGITGLGALACFVAAIVMIIHPGEKNKDHPKYRILRDDR